ncbi:hypothetical protein ACF082_10395 [Streptomyces lydicus]|uniref:hypothetical protein n=1 Tax=Streptomyces lydicus TaxID=47763 RepID=UPI0036FA7C32
MSGFEVDTSQMIQAAMAMMDVMRGVRDTAIGLASELQDQRGMAGDDDAGQTFAAVYRSAAGATLDHIGFGSYIVRATGAGIMQSAREYMATESQVSADLLGKQEDLSANMGDPGADCSSRFIGLGRELPEVVGDTAWYDQYAPGGGDRYRGSAQKARNVAGSWRHAGKLMERFFGEAQICASTARRHHTGVAADTFEDYFKRCIGRGSPPSQAHGDEPLMANLVGACTQLANACDNYADHIDTALAAIDAHKADFFRLDLPWEQPMLGGNGFDGGCGSRRSPHPSARRHRAQPGLLAGAGHTARWGQCASAIAATGRRHQGASADHARLRDCTDLGAHGAGRGPWAPAQ